MPMKKCPKCDMEVGTAKVRCPGCRHVFISGRADPSKYGKVPNMGKDGMLRPIRRSTIRQPED